MSISKIRLKDRSQRAARMLQKGIFAIKLTKTQYFVRSERDERRGYLVTLESCTCFDHKFKTRTCKHIELLRFTQ
ncbi:MAG: hypothetical protein KJI71_01455 [Patescibacteria group bacterium]|nr:hypothetical protein [Patescibacteria group bacterium]